MGVQLGDDARQRVDGEIPRACPSVERLDSEIHGVGSGGDGRLEPSLVASGREDFGAIRTVRHG